MRASLDPDGADEGQSVADHIAGEIEQILVGFAHRLRLMPVGAKHVSAVVANEYRGGGRVLKER